MQNNSVEIILQRLVSFRSYVPYEHEAYNLLSSYLRERGFRVEYQHVSKNRKNMLAQKGHAPSSVLVYSHIDTVPPYSGTKRPMKFKKINGNYLGLGCFDMKGGIAAILSLLDSLNLKKHRLKLVFCVDEEGMSEGVYTLAASSFIRDVVVAFSPEASSIPEHWNLPLVFTIGGRGRCVIRVIIPGRIAHGTSDIQRGNSVEQAVRFVTFLHKWKSAYDSNLGHSSFFIGSLQAQSEGLSLPQHVVLDIDYQTVYGQTAQNVKESLEKYIYGLYDQNVLDRALKSRASVFLVSRSTPYIEAYSISTRNKYVRLVSSLVRKRYGSVSYNYAKSVADQNVIATLGFPVITIGPIGGKAHEPGEWVACRSLQELSKFYRELFSFF